MNSVSLLAGRVLLSLIFIVSGFGKLGAAYGGTQGYMESMGVPGELLPLVILVEIGAGLLVLIGYFTRPAALALAGFSVLSGLLFHFDLADQMQMISLMKNFAVAGGFLALFTAGPGAYSLDARRGGAIVGSYA